jgi:hypothetical protein
VNQLHKFIVEEISLRGGANFGIQTHMKFYQADKQGDNILHMEFKIRMKESLYFGP